MRNLDPEIDHRTYWRARRKSVLKCAYCPPHRNENEGRRPAHGRTKPRYKNHRNH